MPASKHFSGNVVIGAEKKGQPEVPRNVNWRHNEKGPLHSFSGSKNETSKESTAKDQP
jgi:hypothetical protein